MLNYKPATILRMLSETIANQRQELERPVYPESKLEWIRATSFKIINLLEEEVGRFNKTQNDKLKYNDIISACQTALNLLLKQFGVKKKNN